MDDFRLHCGSYTWILNSKCAPRTGAPRTQVLKNIALRAIKIYIKINQFAATIVKEEVSNSRGFKCEGNDLWWIVHRVQINFL